MPQMAPIWWSTLFMMFLLSYMAFMTMMYFFNTYLMNNIEKSTKKNKNINWKW